ncbi:MAG TPA: hypothetical protein ENG45_00410, partial [Candidatus Aenigmarchaeota archaeon]|nr:hypothetical protein [Candidatus Aenigmarchaeota archaeon]
SILTGCFSKLILSILFILAFLLLSFCLSSEQRTDKSSSTRQTYQVVVLRVSDGDTVWVRIDHKEVKLRLLSIDALEKFESKKLYREASECGVSVEYMKSLGKMATSHAREYLHEGDQVKAIVYGHGYYDRALAFIILSNGTNYNEQMVADGYACVYKYRGRKSKELPWEEWKKLNELLEQAKEGKGEDCGERITKL